MHNMEATSSENGRQGVFAPPLNLDFRLLDRKSNDAFESSTLKMLEKGGIGRNSIVSAERVHG